MLRYININIHNISKLLTVNNVLHCRCKCVKSSAYAG